MFRHFQLSKGEQISLLILLELILEVSERRMVFVTKVLFLVLAGRLLSIATILTHFFVWLGQDF